MMPHLFTIQGLLTLIRMHGGTIDSRIRIQKEAFLLRWLEQLGFDDLHFSYHYYGPYSRELSDVLNDAVVSDLVIEKREGFDDGITRYSYKLSKAGEQAIPPNGVDTEVLERIVKRLGQVPWRALELAATIVFLEEEDGLDSASALQRALELKRECQPWQQQAQALLQDLRTEQSQAA